MTGFFAPLAAGAAVLLAGPGDMGFAAGEAIQYGLSRRAVQLLVILAGALGMVLLGYFDDRYELGPTESATPAARKRFSRARPLNCWSHSEPCTATSRPCSSTAALS